MLPANAYRPLMAATALLTLLAVLLFLREPRHYPEEGLPGPDVLEVPCTTLPAQAGWVMAVAFSQQGTLLAIGISEGEQRGHCLLWDVATGRVRATLSIRMGAASALCFSPDGHVLATGDRNGVVRLWDVACGAERAVLTSDHRRVWQLAFSRDGKILAAGSAGTVTLWDTATSRQRGAIPGRAPMAFFPDGKTLSTARVDAAGAKLWDLITGEARHFLLEESTSTRGLCQGHAPEVWRDVLAFAPEGKTLAAVDLRCTVGLWDLERQLLLATAAGHNEAVTAGVFAPDGRVLATASNDRTVRMWDAATGRVQATLAGHLGGVYCVAFSPDGRRLASGGFDKTVRLWDLGAARLGAEQE